MGLESTLGEGFLVDGQSWEQGALAYLLVILMFPQVISDFRVAWVCVLSFLCKRGSFQVTC